MRIPAHLTFVLTAVVAAAACTDGGTNVESGTSSAASAEQAPSGRTPLRLIISGTAVTAELSDNATARDLAAQLPLSSSLRDLNGVEKIAKLARPLTTDGMPGGDDPQIGDLGYYAPSQDLVIYYGDVGYWNGIVRIGRFDTAQLAFIEGRPDGSEVDIAAAE